MLSNTLRLNFCYLKIIHILHPHYYLKITHAFFISNQVAKGLTLKNDLKVKQLAKQPATLGKKNCFFNFKFIEAKFLHNCFWHNLIVYNTI